MVRRIQRKLAFLFRASRARKALDQEMAFHIQCLTEDLMREGMEPKAARREAMLRFGSQERVQARTREARGAALFDETIRNIRFALRTMVRSPLYSITFILTLALCIGFGTGIFSVVDAVLWRPLPYPDPGQLAHAVLYDPALGKSPGNASVDGRSWERIRDEGGAVERAVYSGWVRGVNLSTESEAAFVNQQRVGAGYFRTLGVLPRAGREFQTAEDIPGGPSLAILSHGLWSRTFHEDPDILGSMIRLKGEPHTVVGIMPSSFESPTDADVWTPLQASRSGEGSGSNYAVLVRVPKGMNLEEADARLSAVEPPTSAGQEAPERRFGLVPLAATEAAGAGRTLVVLLGAIGLMLLVGCANLAGLQIARSLARRGEMASRQALGSGSGALVRQTVAENAVLGLFGGLAGLAICFLTIEGLETLVQTHLHTWQDVRLDGRTLVTALGLTTLATLLFGLAPVLQVRNPEISRILVSGSRGVVGRGGHFMRKALLVGQVTMVTALLFAAGLLIRSYGHLTGLEPGFESSQVLTVQYSLDDARYADGESIRRLFQETLYRVRQIPGVAQASVALTLPYERPLNLPFRLPGDEEQDYRLTNAVYVSPGFLETLDIPLLQGRHLQEGDGPGAPIVAVANQAFVEANFEDGQALGVPVQMGFSEDADIEIVGVAGNVLQRAGWGDAATPVWETPTLYLPASQASDGFMQQIHVWFSPSWIIREAGSHPTLAAEVTRAFREVDPELPVARIASLTEVMDQAFASERFEAVFLLVVAGFSLLLAGIGLYGIVAHEVLERSPEMGLRMALGATPARAVWTTGMGGILLTLMGMALGGMASIPVGRVMAGMIYGITPFDLSTLGLLFVVLGASSAVASFVPASRIGRTDPAEILREG